jgi:hypothetical protein
MNAKLWGIGFEALGSRDHPFGFKIKDDSVLGAELLHARLTPFAGT